MKIEDFINRLDQTTNDILETTKNCSLEMLNFKRENSWSVLEILEHIYLTDKVIFTIISKPTTELSSTNEIIGNKNLKVIMIDQRTQRKIISPEILKPKGEIKDLNTFEKVFLTQRETLKDDLKTGKLLIDNRIHKHPFMNDMTISDWLNFTIYHTQRHTEQIKDNLNRIEL